MAPFTTFYRRVRSLLHRNKRRWRMLKKIGLATLFLAGAIGFATPKPAQARPHVYVGVTPYVEPYYYGFGYPDPYLYGPYYTPYYSPYVYGFGWGGGHHWHEHEHEWHGHRR